MKKWYKVLAVLIAIGCVFMACSCSGDNDGEGASSGSPSGAVEDFAGICEFKNATYDDIAKLSDPVTLADCMEEYALDEEEINEWLKEVYEDLAEYFGENYTVTAEIVEEIGLEDDPDLEEEFADWQEYYDEYGYTLEDVKILEAKLTFEGENGSEEMETEFEAVKIDGEWKIEDLLYNLKYLID